MYNRFRFQICTAYYAAAFSNPPTHGPGQNRNDDNLHVGPFLEGEPISERVNTKLKIGRCKGRKRETYVNDRASNNSSQIVYISLYEKSI